MPGAQVVKAFNTVLALGWRPHPCFLPPVRRVIVKSIMKMHDGEVQVQGAMDIP